jgi:Helicase associated domain
MSANTRKKRPRLEAHEDSVWDEMFDTLVHFGIQHSHCNVPFDYVLESGSDGERISLGFWLSQQRNLHKSCLLLPERLEKLQVSFTAHTRKAVSKSTLKFLNSIDAWCLQLKRVKSSNEI